jgi:hypothetical protein
MSSEWLKEKFATFWILKGLSRFIINEQCLIPIPIGYPFANKVNSIEVLQVVIN